MKTLLLLTIAATSIFVTGCPSAVVVDRHHGHGYSSVSYYEGRPYYYSGRSRVWGYPPGYRGSRSYYAPHRSGVIVSPGYHRTRAVYY